MISFDDVVRNQPNKYINNPKTTSTQDTREESVDYGFYESDAQDPGEAWDSIDDFKNQDQPYDCYVGTASTPIIRRAGDGAGAWKSSISLPHEEAKLSALTTSAIEAAKREVVQEILSAAEDLDSAGDSLDSAGDSLDSYIVVDGLAGKYRKCIELLRKHPSKKDALVIIDGTRSDVTLMVAFLCLSGISAAKAGPPSTAIQVATRDQLRRIKRQVDLVINFNMFSSLKELSDRGAVLSRDGNMRTLIVDSLDKEKAELFATELFKCGLSVPFELESYLV